jgi:hypothetical protein
MGLNTVAKLYVYILIASIGLVLYLFYKQEPFLESVFLVAEIR